MFQFVAVGSTALVATSLAIGPADASAVHFGAIFCTQGAVFTQATGTYRIQHIIYQSPAIAVYKAFGSSSSATWHTDTFYSAYQSSSSADVYNVVNAAGVISSARRGCSD
jgi:hypothetical protein